MTTEQDDSLLPLDLVDYSATVETMEIGQAGYITHWSMKVNKARQCFLTGHAEVKETAGGTACLKVQREKGGYRVFASQSRQKWQPVGKISFENIVGDPGDSIIQVAYVE